MSSPNQIALRLFAPIAASYERWAALLSVGQDRRWRRQMVDGLGLPGGSRVLDVAAGTGSISRRLTAAGYQVVAVDLSSAMLDRHGGRWRVLARGEQLPFADGCFGGVTFGYLLRYVEDPVECLRELTRVTMTGGMVGMVEFGLPPWPLYPGWKVYASLVLPGVGRLIDSGWAEVGRFLSGSIESFHRRHPDLVSLWAEAGLVDVRMRSPSLGGGLVMWGRKP